MEDPVCEWCHRRTLGRNTAVVFEKTYHFRCATEIQKMLNEKSEGFYEKEQKAREKFVIYLRSVLQREQTTRQVEYAQTGGYVK